MPSGSGERKAVTPMNKTCKDCIHLKVCEDIDDGIQMCYTGYKGCENFKDKDRFIELPCAVGDTVWFKRNGIIIETYVEKIVLKHRGLYLKLECNAVYETTVNSIGKTVFLTKEGAEKALKGVAE